LNVKVAEPIFEMVAERSEGSMRDAESLFEKVLSAQEDGALNLEAAYEMLGYFHHDIIHELDLAFHQKELKSAFLISDTWFKSHYLTVLCVNSLAPSQ